ncbi:MAG: arginase family protein, partial [Planctomycetota bacterium]
MNIPHATPTIAYRAAKPGSLAATIEAESSEGCRVALLGVPDDTGVRLNAGRPGAVEGPIAFREAMIRGYAADCAGGPLPRVFDAGDVHRAGSLADTHERVTEATAALAGAGLLPVMIGGGHDLTFPFVRAIAQQLDEPMVGVYFDAHLDVRTEEGSGMPFHRLIEG